jgi:hypothetical protein
MMASSFPQRSDMQCIVIGITPPDELLADQVRENVQIEGLVWQPGHSTARDHDDSEGILTLLMTAIIVEEEMFTLDDAVTAVGDYLCKKDASTGTVELWASAGALLPLRPLEGYEPHIMAKSTKDDNNDGLAFDFLEKAQRAMQEWGLVIQPQIMSSKLVAGFQHLVNEAITTVESRLARFRPSLQIGKDTFCFQEIASRNQNRFDLRLDTICITEEGGTTQRPAITLVCRLLKESPTLQKFLISAIGTNTDSGSDSIWDESLDFDVSVVYSRPGAPAQGWHADGNHLPGAPDAGWILDEKENRTPRNAQLAAPYAICLFVPLIDLNEDVGYTQFWPGSHAHRKLVGMGSVAHVTQSTWNSQGCRAGDGVLYDYRLMHQGMPHSVESKVEIRPILQIIFKQKSYVEKANYGSEPIVKS